MNEILAAIWFFLPTGIANATPVVAMHIPWIKKLNYPLDFGKSWGGKRIFGDHKTFRGLITGMIIGLLVAGLQAWLFNMNILRELSWVNFDQVNWIAFGLLSGAGALLGDAVKSFFKRRQNLKPGATWFPFDQIDYIVGAILFTLPIIHLVWWRYLLVAIIWLIMHPLATLSGYLLKLKDSPI